MSNKHLNALEIPHEIATTLNRSETVLESISSSYTTTAGKQNGETRCRLLGRRSRRNGSRRHHRRTATRRGNYIAYTSNTKQSRFISLQVEVTVAGVPDGSNQKCSRDVVIKPDVSITDVFQMGVFDVMVLPGGLGGTKLLSENPDVRCLLKEQEENTRFIAAICAGKVRRISR